MLDPTHRRATELTRLDAAARSPSELLSGLLIVIVIVVLLLSQGDLGVGMAL